MIVSENSENDESEIPYSVCNLRGARGVPLQGALPRSPRSEEHPYLVGLKRSGLKTPIVGFLYKDTVGAGRQVLEDTGNPYDVVIFEEKNKVGIDLGVTGVPETFIIDKKGVIRAKVSYPILDDLWNIQVKPLIEILEKEK